MIVDTHMHVWNANAPSSNPWRPGWARFAPLPAFSPQDALGAMTTAGVDRAVLIPPDWDRSASDLAGSAAKAHPDRFLAFGSISLSVPLAPESVRRFCVGRGLSGLRQVLLPGARSGRIDSAEWLWDALEALSIPVMIWMPDQTSGLRSLVRDHPHLRVTVDHLNLPMAASSRQAAVVIREVCELARYSNLAVKASALPSLIRCGFTPTDLVRVGRNVIDAYGSSRVFWGADFLRLPCSYRDSLSMWLDPASFTPTERADVLGDAALRWFHWPSA